MSSSRPAAREGQPEQALRSYLEGRITDHELHQELAYVTHFDLVTEGCRSVDFTNSLVCEVEVSVPQVVNRLQEYLRGRITADELMQWAAHLTLIDAYVTAGWHDDAQADRFEPMWHVLQQLSSPAIDGEITPERVSEYLLRLAAI